VHFYQPSVSRARRAELFLGSPLFTFSFICIPLFPVATRSHRAAEVFLRRCRQCEISSEIQMRIMI